MFLNKMKKKYNNLVEYYLLSGIIYYKKKMWSFAYISLKKSILYLKEQEKIFAREIYVKYAISCYNVKKYAEAEKYFKNLYYENSYDYLVA